MFNLWYIVIGLIGGILGGMGMGGGTLLIPLLVIFLKVEQQKAQALNLIAFIPMAIIAVIIHIKNKLVKFKYLLYVSLPATVVSCVIAFLSLKLSNSILRRCFGIFILIIGLWLLAVQVFKFFFDKQKNTKYKK